MPKFKNIGGFAGNKNYGKPIKKEGVMKKIKALKRKTPKEGVISETINKIRKNKKGPFRT